MAYRIYIPLVVLLLVSMSCGVFVEQGSGNLVTEDRDVSGFSSVELSGIGKLNITQDESEALEIEAEDNIIDEIVTRVSGDTLHIEYKRGFNVRPTKPIVFNLVMEEIESVEISGAGSISTADIEADELLITVSGVGDVTIESLEAEELVVDLSGGGSFELSGEVEEQSVELSGAGNYEAADLESQHTSVMISGAGSASVWVEETLEVEISGAGSLDYYGSPQITQEISGVGSVKGLGEH